MFDRDAREVARARHFVVDKLAQWKAGVDPDVVALLVSELVTNSLRHGAGPVEVDLQVQDDRVVLQVTDAGGGEPRLHVPGPTEESGRGLTIVDRLSSDWGSDHDHDGHTRVWCEVSTGA